MSQGKHNNHSNNIEVVKLLVELRPLTRVGNTRPEAWYQAPGMVLVVEDSKVVTSATQRSPKKKRKNKGVRS